jgi:predicted GH43/DUF377 family glycosyl hydrolase
MERYAIGRTDACLRCAFNGAMVAKVDGRYTNIVQSREGTSLLNIYRNSKEPRSPCNISCKYITFQGDIDNTNEAAQMKDIFSNDCNEDPRIFFYNGDMYISYNKVEFKQVGFKQADEGDADVKYSVIDNVKVFYTKLTNRADGHVGGDDGDGVLDGNDSMDGMEDDQGECLGFNIGDEIQFPVTNVNIWEKNWGFFEYHEELYMIYSLYPLVIYNSNGSVVRRCHWAHPYDIQQKLVHNPRITMNMDVRVLKSFKSANELFKYQEYEFDIRGGAPPILYDNKYYMFAHSREMPHALYKMIVIVLDQDLKMYGFTYPFDNEPSERIVYPMGVVMVEDEQTWYISCGVNDVDQVLLKLPHEFLLQKLIYFDETKHVIKPNS